MLIKTFNRTGLSDVNICILVIAFITYISQYYNSVYLTKCESWQGLKGNLPLPDLSRVLLYVFLSFDMEGLKASKVCYHNRHIKEAWKWGLGFW